MLLMSKSKTKDCPVRRRRIELWSQHSPEARIHEQSGPRKWPRNLLVKRQCSLISHQRFAQEVPLEPIKEGSGVTHAGRHYVAPRYNIRVARNGAGLQSGTLHIVRNRYD